MDTRRLMLLGIDTNLPPEETCYDYCLGPMSSSSVWIKGKLRSTGDTIIDSTTDSSGCYEGLIISDT